MSTPSNPSRVALRKATATDTEFVWGVLDRTIRLYVEMTFGRWAEAEARARASAGITAGKIHIIEVDGQPIGIMKVDRTETHIQLEQLFILPEHQRRGIGSGLLEGLQTEAREAGLPVRLRVLRVNPAKRLYERHGFCVASEEPERFHMQWTP